MNWANYTMILLMVLSLGISLGGHGTKKTGKTNAWINIVSTIVEVILLYFGGWFN